MKTWTVRVIAFFFIALGALAMNIFIDRALKTTEITQDMHQRRAQELKTLGLLLADWIADGEQDKLTAFLKNKAAEGMHITLFNDQLERLAGSEPTPQTLDWARRALKTRDLEGDAEQPGPFPPHMPEREALCFSDLNGAVYVMTCSMPPLVPPHSPTLTRRLTILSISVVIALLVVLVLIPGLERPLTELGKAFRRLSCGDLNVRVGTPQPWRSDAFSRLAEEFNATVENLAQQQQDQKLLLCSISHDMRSPLSRLTLAADMALTEKSHNSLRLLERIRRDATRLNALVGQMTELMNASAGRSPAARVDLAELTAEVAEACGFEASQQDRSVVLVEAPTPCTIQGHSDQLRSMLENIIRNGIRHTPRGTRVTVSLQKSERNGRPCAAVQICDQGSGVPHTELTNIFKPFYRIPRSMPLNDEKGEAPGLGLGLAIAQYVAVSHSGRIHAENIAEGGFMVVVQLPLDQPVDTTIRSQPTAAIRQLGRTPLVQHALRGSLRL